MGTGSRTREKQSHGDTAAHVTTYIRMQTYAGRGRLDKTYNALAKTVCTPRDGCHLATEATKVASASAAAAEPTVGL